MVGAALAVALLLTPASASTADVGPDGDDILVTVPAADGSTAISNAQLRWGLNRESGSGAFAGGCNFLSAGRAGNAGSAHVWSEGDRLYRATEGAVRIEKPTAAGEWATSTFAGRCLDAHGNAVSVSSLTSATGNQVVIEGGTGTRVTRAGLEIRWTGSFTIVFYGGLTYWSISDPVLTLDRGGNGRVTATATGYGTAMDDMTRWEQLPARSIVIAELRGVDIDATTGFSVLPEYLGVAVDDAGQIARTPENTAHWGSFPASFMDYQRRTGQLGYWLSTGGQRDPAKPATPLYVSYDAHAPINVPDPVSPIAEVASPVNLTRFRPAASPGAEVANVDFATGTPLATMPEQAGLVPAMTDTPIPAALAPALGAVLAILVAILSVLSLTRTLPWQGASRRT